MPNGKAAVRRNFSHWRVCAKVIAILFAIVGAPVSAQVEVFTNYDERISNRGMQNAQDIDGTFGARTQVATAGVSFSIPVLTIPGNNGLDITVSYKLGLRNFGGGNEWYFEEENPYLTTVVSREVGWVTKAGSSSRCSGGNSWEQYAPPTVNSSTKPGLFYADEYWSGYFLSLPNGGGRLNHYDAGQTPASPSTGGPYYWVTDDHWYFSCITLPDGGQGFVGRSPDGLKYYFDTFKEGLWLPDVIKILTSGTQIDLERQELRLYPSKIEDRFGNYLAGLTASDGRSVTRTVSGPANNIVTYTYGTRQWVVQTLPPFSVTYPDGTVWSAAVSGNLFDPVYAKSSCPGGNPTAASGTTTATIQSRSGATGVYTFKQALIGYSYVSGQCAQATGAQGNYNQYPAMLPSYVLSQRTVSGPGMAPDTLTVTLGSHNGCYSNSLYFSPKCVAGSPTTRTVTYSRSSGTYTRYTIGNRVWVNADLVLKVEEGEGANPPLRTTDLEYSLIPSVGSFVGFVDPYSVNERKRVATVSKTITQDGRTFSWKVATTCGSGALCLDQYGRPTVVTKMSTTP